MFTMQIKGCRSALFTVPSCTLSLSVWQLPLCFDSAVQCSSQHGRVSPPPPPPQPFVNISRATSVWQNYSGIFIVAKWFWWCGYQIRMTLFLLPKCIFAVEACWLIFAKEKKQTKQNWKALLVKDVSIHLVHLTKYSLRHHKKCMVILLCTFSIDKLPVSRPGSRVCTQCELCVNLCATAELDCLELRKCELCAIWLCLQCNNMAAYHSLCHRTSRVPVLCSTCFFLFFFEVQEIFSLLILLSWSAADSLNSPFRICFGHESRRSVPTRISADVSSARPNITCTLACRIHKSALPLWPSQSGFHLLLEAPKCGWKLGSLRNTCGLDVQFWNELLSTVLRSHNTLQASVADFY